MADPKEETTKKDAEMLEVDDALAQKSELSDSDLESVAGGAACGCENGSMTRTQNTLALR